MPTSGRYEASELSRGDIRAEILAFDSVSVGYGGELVLQDLSFNVRRGEVAGLVALDARGKSTLVRCAAGLLAPVKGTVLHDGRDIYAMGFADDQRFRAKTATVFEGGALFANRSIEQNVALPLRYHLGGGEDQAAEFVRRLLERVGYHEPLGAFPWQVSARGRRLAAFARALVREPDLVIVDRFFEALEPQDSKRLMELILELNVKNGTSFLLVGELEPLIFQVAERVVVLEGGKILAHGFKRALYKNARIKSAFETGELSGFPAGPDEQKPEPLPDFEAAPPPRNPSRALPAGPLRMSPPAPAAAPAPPGGPSDASDEGDAGKTLTLEADAAAAVIAEARARADARIEEEARKLESEGLRRDAPDQDSKDRKAD